MDASVCIMSDCVHRTNQVITWGIVKRMQFGVARHCGSAHARALEIFNSNLARLPDPGINGNNIRKMLCMYTIQLRELTPSRVSGVFDTW